MQKHVNLVFRGIFGLKKLAIEKLKRQQWITAYTIIIIFVSGLLEFLTGNPGISQRLFFLSTSWNTQFWYYLIYPFLITLLLNYLMRFLLARKNQSLPRSEVSVSDQKNSSEMSNPVNLDEASTPEFLANDNPSESVEILSAQENSFEEDYRIWGLAYSWILINMVFYSIPWDLLHIIIDSISLIGFFGCISVGYAEKTGFWEIISKLMYLILTIFVIGIGLIIIFSILG